MEDSPYLRCCIELIAIPLGVTIYAIYSLKADAALEQLAIDKGYKILRREEYKGFRNPIKYSKYAKIFLVSFEDKDGLTRTAKVVADGSKIVEVKWDD